MFCQFVRFRHASPKGASQSIYLCTDDEIKQMYSDANNMKASADSRILRGYSIDDIDMPTLRQYRRAYDIKHENHPWTEVDDKQFLENIGAYRKDRATSTRYVRLWVDAELLCQLLQKDGVYSERV